MKKWWFMALLALSLGACNADDEGQQTIVSGNGISISEAILSPLGGQIKFSITSDQPWDVRSASSIPGWITMYPTSGVAGTTMVEIFAEPARGNVEMDLAFISRTNREEIGSIYLYQEKPYIEFSAENFEFDWSESEISTSLNNVMRHLTVESNIDWRFKVDENQVEVSSNADNMPLYNKWLLGSLLQGTSDESRQGVDVQFVATDYNLDSVPRQVTIGVELDDQLDQLVTPPQITISQRNKRLIAQLENGLEEKAEFAPCNADTLRVTIDSEFEEWHVAQKPAWLSLKDEQGTIGAITTDMAAVPNTSRQDIEGVMVLEASAGVSPEPRREIPVKIRAYDFPQQLSHTISNGETSHQMIGFTSSGAWAVDEATVPEWLTMSTSSGIGKEYGGEDEYIGFNLNSRNYETTSRAATITVNSTEPNADFTANCVVTEAAYQLSASLATSIFGPDDLNTKNMNITSSGVWSVSTDADWLYLSQSQGSGDARITFNALSQNTSTTNDRKATITLVSETHKEAGRSLVREYEVTQQKFIFEVAQKNQTFTFDALETSTSKSISINCSTNWSVSADSWIELSRPSGSGAMTITAKVKENTNTSARSGKITISSSFGGKNYSANISVKQNGLVFDTNTVTLTKFAAIGATAQTVSLSECQGGWEIASKPSWMNVSPTSGTTGNEQLSFRPNDNEALDASGKERSGDVIIRSTKNESITKTINVSQDVHIFAVSASAISFAATNPAAQSVTITCNKSWQATSNASWLTLSPTSGSGNGTLTVTAKPNEATSTLSGTITVTSGTLTRTITVTQAAAPKKD